MPYDAKCKWCGRGYEKPILLTIKSAYQGKRRNYCSDKCFSEATGDDNSSSGKSSNIGSSFMKEFVSSSDTSSGKSAEQIRAISDSKTRKSKEVDDSDDRLYDSIKKLILFPLNKKAKEKHLKLEEMETDISIAISKGNIDEAASIIRQLKHGSSFFVPKTNTTYSQYWTSKRENFLDTL